MNRRRLTELLWWLALVMIGAAAVTDAVAGSGAALGVSIAAGLLVVAVVVVDPLGLE